MSSSNDKLPTFFSGAQPSGVLHIGNYFGAMKQWVNMQDTHETFVAVVDLHALTVPQEPRALTENIVSTAADFMAAGIDPAKSTIFVQSQVLEHTELMWILSTLTAMGDLERMVSYKEKREEGKSALAGLFTYPILMAADILAYKAAYVPVGEDQEQHLELVREIARRFNMRFKEIFPLPKAVKIETGARIMSLQDPRKKMSKSHAPNSYIALSDSSEEIRNKIASAVTDSGTTISYDPKTRPAIANLVELYHLFSGQDIETIESSFVNVTYQQFKERLADLIIEQLRPIQDKRRDLLADRSIILDTLKKGAYTAQIVARQTLDEVRSIVGLDIYK